MSQTTEIEHVAIGKLLERYRLAVPDYQRAYAWKETQIEELLNDVLEALERQEPDYFLGSVVLTSADSGGPPVIVDGQQRLASTTMIYAAIRDYLAEHGEEETAGKIANRYLYSTDDWGSDPKPKLLLSVDDRSFFQNYVLENPDADTRITTLPSSPGLDSHCRIAEAFRTIRSRIDSIATGALSDPLGRLKAIDQYLASNVRVVVVTSASESNAFQIFETLNDRGLELSIADLLKNYVFGKAGEDKVEEAKNYWIKATSLVSAEGGERSVLRFIHHYWSSNVGLVRAKDLFKSIKKDITSPHHAVDFAIKLHSNSNLYAAILNPGHDLWSGVGPAGQDAVSALRFLKVEQNKPLMLACLDVFDAKKPEELRKLLELLVGWAVRFKVTGRLGSAKLEQFYGSAGAGVRKNQLNTAKSVADAFSGDVPTDAEFRDDFERLEEKTARFSRYYLREIENYLREKNGDMELEVLRDTRKVNLEHIFPQNPTAAAWPAFSQETGPLHVDRLGNHALMIKAENDKIGNQEFAIKKPILAASSLALTNQIGDAADWTPHDIASRQAILATHAVSVWKRTT